MYSGNMGLCQNLDEILETAELLRDRPQIELVLIGGGERLLDAEPVLQASIDRRNPFVDPLSFVQIELLSRLRAEDADSQAKLGRVSLLTINGIASGLRNTG